MKNGSNVWKMRKTVESEIFLKKSFTQQNASAWR